MKILLILAAVGVAAWLGFHAFGRIIGTEERDKGASAAVAAAVTPGPSAGSTLGNPGELDFKVVRHAVHVFKNRTVPAPPFQTASAVASEGVQVATDADVNAWVIRGNPGDVANLLGIAEALDLEQTELDLDFVLIAVAEDVMRSAGLSVAFGRGASYVPTLDIQPGSMSLRLGAGEWSVGVDLAGRDGSVRLVSSPVIRIVTGRKWEFGTDQEIPVSATLRSEGVVSTSYEYRKVGLGLVGVVQKVGGLYRLELEQRNGTVDSAAATGSGEAPPSFRNQTLETSLLLSEGQWSCAGGVRSWRSEEVRKFLGKRIEESEDLLIVFVRPRSWLEVPARAVPVRPDNAQTFDGVPWQGEGNPLLPAKGWEESGGAWQGEERAFLKSRGVSERPGGRAAVLGHPSRR